MPDGQNKLTIQMVEPGAGVDADAFARVLHEFVALLRILDQHLTGAKDDMDWEIIHASLNSPIEVELEGRPRKIKNRTISVTDELVRGFGSLDAPPSHGDRWSRFPRQLRPRLQRLHKALGRREGRLVNISAPSSQKVSVTPEVAKKAVDRLPQRKKQAAAYTSLTTQIGTLVAIEFQPRPLFKIIDPITQRRIECRVGRDLMKKALANGDKRVEVEGVAHYDANDQMIRIDARNIEPMPDDASLPSEDDLRPLPIGEGPVFDLADILGPQEEEKDASSRLLG